MQSAADRLDLLKTLGDNTRYAIYLELARSASPLSTATIAETLGLHSNTVRPHLERMREVGLVDSRPDTSGSVGRPQNLFSLADEAPSLGLEPPVYPMLAKMLIDVTRNASVDSEISVAAGRDEGRRRVQGLRSSDGSLVPAISIQEELGFDPTVVEGEDRTTIAFTHCPFAELAQRSPEVICALHRGLVEGSVEEQGEFSVEAFRDLSDRNPCQVDLALSSARANR